MPYEELCLYLLLALFAALILIFVAGKKKRETFDGVNYEKEKNYYKNPLLDVFEIGISKKEKNELLRPEIPMFNKPILNQNYNFKPNDPDGFTLEDFVRQQGNPPPSQPFIPSPPFDLAVPYEAFSGLDFSLDNINSNPNNFNKLKNAYKPNLMDLPPLVPRDRLLPPDQQPRDIYSGYPVGTYLTDENFNKFYHQFVPDYLWCKSGVCGN